MAAPAGYIEIEDISAYGYQVDLDNNQDLFDRLIPRASEFFDTLCGVEPGHFLVKDTEFSEKVIYGSGGVLLTIPAFIEIESLTGPTGVTVPSYVAQSGYLRVVDSDGAIQSVGLPYSQVWPNNVRFTVSAKWGYSAVPENVKQATVEILMLMWREKDPAFTKAVDLDVANPDSIPSRVRTIARAIRNQQPCSSAFV